jgi:hypothetical protein
MNNFGAFDWFLAAAIVAAAVYVSVTLFRLVRSDGYGSTPLLDPRRDWGSQALPSIPYAQRRSA